MARRVNDEQARTPRVVMLGPPGSGKGTVARALAAHFCVPHVSVGAVLRREIGAMSTLGREVAAAVATGELVDDTAIADVVRSALDPATAPDGWVLDGAPRTLEQARLLAALFEARGWKVIAIALSVDAAELRERLLLRGEREGRSDDEPDVISHRLEVWRSTSPALLDYYEQQGLLAVVDGTGAVNDVCERVIAAVETALRTASS